MPGNATLEFKEFRKAFRTEPTQKAPIKSNEAVSFCLDFVRTLPLIEGYAPLPRPYRTQPSQTAATDAEIAAWDAASDEAWDSIED